eukprot:Skav210228  [mRNA]  locus=scaffold2884:15410:16682:+ [translate_table: standard]
MAMTQQPPNLARSRYNAAFQSSIFEPPTEQMQSSFIPAGKRRDQTTAEIFGSYDEKDRQSPNFQGTDSHFSCISHAFYDLIL